jgi:hypothetical protein
MDVSINVPKLFRPALEKVLCDKLLESNQFLPELGKLFP